VAAVQAAQEDRQVRAEEAEFARLDCGHRFRLRVQESPDSLTIRGRGAAEAVRDKSNHLFGHGRRSEHLESFLVTRGDVATAVSCCGPL
jgi:hypothetical protein